MKYICINCNYLYDESLGDLGEGIEPGTTIENMIGKKTCPSCGESIEDFQQINEEILYAEDSDNLSDFEKKHIPFIKTLDDEKIKIIVGEKEHPMEEEHFISSIMLYDEYGDLIEEVFLTYDEKLEAIFDRGGLDDFELRARCNLHGLWSTGIIKNS